jgi:hypothetical protein
MLPKALNRIEFRRMGRLKQGNDIFRPLDRPGPMGRGTVKLHHRHRVTKGLREVIEKLLKIHLIEVGVGLTPVPSAQRFHDPIKPKRLSRPVYFGNRFDPFGGNDSRRLGLAANATLILGEIAQGRQVENRLKFYQGKAEGFLNIAIASGACLRL